MQAAGRLGTVLRLAGLAGALALAPAAFADPALAPAPAAAPAGTPAPALVGIAGWLNGQPTTLAALRGKVVLIDFWAYSCINCIRTLPWLEKWQRDYGPKGLVVIGVHTPEFPFETNPRNIQSAIDRFHINYRVAEDDDCATWNAFHNEYWPAEYLIDRSGRIVYTHFGEGEYGTTENAIRAALGIATRVGQENGVDLGLIGSPEMYFGLDRVADLASAEVASPGTHLYTAPATLPLNRFALVGRWTLLPQQATLDAPEGGIMLHCHSAKVFMVASAPAPVTIAVTVDGVRQPDVTVAASRLYTLLNGSDYADHAVTLDIHGRGLSAYTFTFG